MKFRDIPQHLKGHYRVHQSWGSLQVTMQRYCHEIVCPLNMNPDYQRGHVWSEKQQAEYIEFKLQGGTGSDEIYLNCPGWMKSFKGPFELVDGKQRLEAVLKFLRNELTIFNKWKFCDFEDRLPSDCCFSFNINDLETRSDVLSWYYQLNSGGTPHKKGELEKVQELMRLEVINKPNRLQRSKK